MEPKELETLADIKVSVGKVQTSLRALAIVKLADEFYPRDERRRLVKEFSALRVQTKLADDDHKRAAKKVRENSLDASEESRERDLLWEITKPLHDSLAKMRAAHPLIQEIVDARDAICARDHMNQLL